MRNKETAYGEIFPWVCSRKNLKLLFCAGIALAAGVRIYIFLPMRLVDTILPGSPPRGNIKGRANHFSPSSRFPTGQQHGQTRQRERADSLFSLPHWLAAGQASQHDRSQSLSSLASRRTDHLFPLSPQSSPLSIMRRARPIYGPLMSGKSFFYH